MKPPHDHLKKDVHKNLNLIAIEMGEFRIDSIIKKSVNKEENEKANILNKSWKFWEFVDLFGFTFSIFLLKASLLV